MKQEKREQPQKGKQPEQPLLSSNNLAIIRASDHPPTVPYPALLVRSGKAWRDLQRTVTYGEV